LLRLFSPAATRLAGQWRCGLGSLVRCKFRLQSLYISHRRSRQHYEFMSARSNCDDVAATKHYGTVGGPCCRWVRTLASSGPRPTLVELRRQCRLRCGERARDVLILCGTWPPAGRAGGWRSQSGGRWPLRRARPLFCGRNSAAHPPRHCYYWRSLTSVLHRDRIAPMTWLAVRPVVAAAVAASGCISDSGQLHGNFACLLRPWVSVSPSYRTI